MLLVGRQEEHPAGKIEWWGVGVVICLQWGADCLYVVQLCMRSSWCHCHPKTPSSLAWFKSRLVLPFWYMLAQVVLEKRPLNGCSSVVVVSTVGENCSIFLDSPVWGWNVLSTIAVYVCSEICLQCFMPSVLWHCWLGGRKGIRPVKNWAVGCWHGYLPGARCRLAYGPADATATHCLLLQ